MQVEETVIERKYKNKNVEYVVKKESKSNDVSIINKLIINAQNITMIMKAGANKRPSDLLLTAQWALNWFLKKSMKKKE